MIFRKTKRSAANGNDEASRRGRRRRDRGEADPYAHLTGSGTARESAERPEQATPAQGPYDADEVDLSGLGPRRVDLGGLVVSPLPEMELRLQVDEATKAVVAALLVHGESALELRPFAAPRNGRLWDEVRREIAAETTRRGGVATENKGPYGPELKVMVPMRAQDGTQVTQVSRIMGVDGPRWLLRGTLVGKAANEPQAAAPLLHAMSQVVVVRGKAPMAPRDQIPLRLPQEKKS